MTKLRCGFADPLICAPCRDSKNSTIFKMVGYAQPT
jgi:hypothetical protein